MNSDNFTGSLAAACGRDETGIVQRIGSICATKDAPELIASPNGLHFTGIHAMSQKSLQYIEEGFQCVVRSAYTHMVPERKVQSIVHKGTWFDTGIPKEYFEANMQTIRSIKMFMVNVENTPSPNIPFVLYLLFVNSALNLISFPQE